MNRKTVWMLILFALASIYPAEAQQANKVPRLGFLAGSRIPDQDAFRQGLRELGYVEGKNVLTEYRYAEGKLERLPELAAELVRLKVNVIVAGGATAIRAAKQASSTIPIVVGGAGDLVGMGLVASLARPGGNVTGSTRIDPDFSGKRLELLKEAFPKVSRVAVLHAGSDDDQDELRETQAAARALKLQIQPFAVKDPSQFQNAYAAMTKERAEALIIFHGTVTLAHRKQLLELANKNRLPTMCGQAIWSEDGGLISYGPNAREFFRRAAYFVDKILKGAKPADLPVEQPTKFDFIINLKTAKQIGVTISPNVLARADRVIK